MDNEAFRALVNQGTKRKVKSTKEIAREAVEEEFKLKNQKRKNRCRSQNSSSGAGAGAGAGSGSGAGAGAGSHRNHADSDSDYSNAGSADSNSENENKKLENEDPKHENNLDKKSGKYKRKKREGTDNHNATGYRDRAKERRKGLNIDYEESSNLLSAADALNDKDMSKFLGGDEQHTHLVKGLDLALAQKVRRDQQQSLTNSTKTNSTEPKPDTQILLPQNQKPNGKNSLSSIHLTSTLSSIQDRLQTILKQSSPSNAHQQSIISYLIAKSKKSPGFPSKIPTSLAGFQIQRSTTTFTFHANIHDPTKAWEFPKEVTMSKTQYYNNQQQKNNATTSVALNNPTATTLLHNNNNTTAIDAYTLPTSEDDTIGFTSLDHLFIQRIQAVLLSPEEEQDEGNTKTKRHKYGKSGCSKKKSTSKLVKSDHSNSHNDFHFHSTKSFTDNNHQDPQNGENQDEDEDEDIFTGLGEYIPQKTTSNTKTSITQTNHTQKISDQTIETYSSKHKKMSVFEDLALNTDSNTSNHILHHNKINHDHIDNNKRTARHHSISNNTSQSSHGSKSSTTNVIDRDIFGTRTTFRKNSNHNNASKATHGKGIIISSYEGGYGEEMDVDFDGTLDTETDDIADEDKATQKKKKATNGRRTHCEYDYN